MEEGPRILELVQDIKNTYVKAKLEDKAKILKILSSNCTLKGVSVTFHWNKPFDILFKLGQSKEKGERGVLNSQPLDSNPVKYIRFSPVKSLFYVIQLYP